MLSESGDNYLVHQSKESRTSTQLNLHKLTSSLGAILLAILHATPAQATPTTPDAGSKGQSMKTPKNTPESLDAAEDAIAREVDARVLTLSASDQENIAKIREAIASADDEALYVFLKAFLDHKPMISDSEMANFFYTTAYVASNYLGTTEDCMARGFWFMLYMDALRKTDPVCMESVRKRVEGFDEDSSVVRDSIKYLSGKCSTPDSEKISLADKAQSYVRAISRAARNGQKYYCQ